MTARFTQCGDFDALGLAELGRTGQVSPQIVMDAALARIATVNPARNAIVEECHSLATQQIAAGLPVGRRRAWGRRGVDW